MEIDWSGTIQAITGFSGVLVGAALTGWFAIRTQRRKAIREIIERIHNSLSLALEKMNIADDETAYYKSREPAEMLRRVYFSKMYGMNDASRLIDLYFLEHIKTVRRAETYIRSFNLAVQNFWNKVAKDVANIDEFDRDMVFVAYGDASTEVEKILELVKGKARKYL